MKCAYCGRQVDNVWYYKGPGHFGPPIPLCEDCMKLVHEHTHHHPYSRVSKRISIMSAGYPVTSKIARLNRAERRSHVY
jgi:hypothetical protein